MLFIQCRINVDATFYNNTPTLIWRCLKIEHTLGWNAKPINIVTKKEGTDSQKAALAFCFFCEHARV